MNKLCQVLLFHLFFTSVQCEPLRATYSKVKVPVKGHAARLWYDGSDSIYIFGPSSYQSKLFRYSLSNDTLQTLETLPVRGVGTIQTDESGNIFCFNSNVLKFSRATNSTSVVARLPYRAFATPTIKLDDGVTVLMLGTYCRYDGHGDCVDKGREIISFDLTTNTYHILSTRMSISLQFGAAIKFGPGKAFVFPVGKSEIFKRDQDFMWEMNLTSLTFTKVPDIVLPGLAWDPVVMTDGHFIFLMGGFEPSEQFPDWRGFFKIDPIARTVEFVHVDNWPIYEEPPPCVYIHKLTRVYCVGGFSQDRHGVFHSDSYGRDENDIFNDTLAQVSGRKEI